MTAPHLRDGAGPGRRVAARRRDAAAAEQGAVLVLALLLLLIGTVVVGALSYSVTNDLTNSARFGTVRSLQYAARSATNLAIQNVRYTPLIGAGQTLNASPPAPCWGSGAISETASLDGSAPMAAWCSTSWTPTSANTRVVTISTCPATESAAACAAGPLLQAVVTFDDYPPGVSAPTSQQCVEYCGSSMELDSWQWEPVLPSVSGLSPTTGPITGGTPITITGSGFVQGATVTFIEESGGAPTSDNVVLPAGNVAVHSATSISATAPAVTAGSTYFVAVSTPAGTGPFGADVFTFTPVAPTISAISPSQGSIAGGTSVTVTGSGFVVGSKVKFVEESGGVPVSGAAPLAGGYVDVTSSSTLTVVTPGVTSVGTYFLTVTTPAGTTPTSGSDVFSYSYLVPTVNAVAPSAGPDAGGTAITITGTGFITGATVSFVKESSGCGGPSLAASNVVVVGSSTITATSPSVSAAAPYYVYVTTQSGPNRYSSSCFPLFNYTG